MKHTAVSYRCGAAARWLPRVAAAAVLLAFLLVSFRFQAWESNPGGSPLRVFMVVIGAAIGLWILRSGAEVRLKVDLEDERVRLSYGTVSSTVALDKVDRFEFDHPMTASRRLLPAAVLLDEKGTAWRLPVVLESGADLIDAIVERSGREDLAAWADSLPLRQRMNRAGLVTAVGYGAAAAVVASGVWFYLR